MTTIVWTRLDGVPSLEHFTLKDRELDGRVVASVDGIALAVSYTIACDEAWKTRSVRVHALRGAEDHAIEIDVDDERRWHINEAHRPEFDGLADVDLAITPSTNTLPVHRLQLAVGESASVTAVWIRFPSLEIVPLAQRYTRLADRRYRYESPNFAADVDVDEWGLVTRYDEVWGRV